MVGVKLWGLFDADDADELTLFYRHKLSTEVVTDPGDEPLGLLDGGVL